MSRRQFCKRQPYAYYICFSRKCGTVAGFLYPKLYPLSSMNFFVAAFSAIVNLLAGPSAGSSVARSVSAAYLRMTGQKIVSLYLVYIAMPVVKVVSLRMA